MSETGERVNNEKFVKVILLQNIILLNSILTLSVYHWVSTIIFNLLQGELQFAHFTVVQHKAELRGIWISYFDLKSFILSRPGWFRKLAATAHSYNSPVSTLLSSQVQNNFKMFSRPQSWIVLTPALGDITQTNSTIKLRLSELIQSNCRDNNSRLSEYLLAEFLLKIES